MSVEVWDIIDENGVPTGRTTLRGRCLLKSGEYHLVVHIWIVSQDGRFLIQRRADDKKLMPGEWAATGGAAVSGEDSFTAAARELYEELGIRSDRQSLKKLLRIKRRSSLLDIKIRSGRGQVGKRGTASQYDRKWRISQLRKRIF